ncbi:MAG: hypothetical protein MUE59_09365 [Thiobacillaceae bacterium]|nr:hypothetical protein [Thiobacillaceae bacterium]
MSKKTLITTAIGSAFVASMAATPIASAADNPFALSSLSSGYQVADNHAAKPMEGKGDETKAEAGKTSAEKMKDGKCGEGKCGAKTKTETKAKEGKCGEGKCGAMKK